MSKQNYIKAPVYSLLLGLWHQKLENIK